jgi:hypothetical protein
VRLRVSTFAVPKYSRMASFKVRQATGDTSVALAETRNNFPQLPRSSVGSPKPKEVEGDVSRALYLFEW